MFLPNSSVKLGKVVGVGIVPEHQAALQAMLTRLPFSTVVIAEGQGDPMASLTTDQADVVVTGYRSAGYDGPKFITAVRHSDLACRRALVIMVSALTTRAIMNEARDAGIDEVLLQPFDEATLQKRIEHLTLKPRPWIEAMGYIGPDRRRFNTGASQGPRKRQVSRAPGHLVHIEQAVRILNGAVEGFESNRHQALRSIAAQMYQLTPACPVLMDASFTEAVRQLDAALNLPGPTQADFSRPVRSLALFLKIDGPRVQLVTGGGSRADTPGQVREVRAYD